MMRMVNTLPRSRFQRMAASNSNSLISDQRIENGLLQRRWPDVRSECLAVDRDINTLMRFIWNDLNTFGRCIRNAAVSKRDGCNHKAQYQELTHTPFPQPSPAASCRRRSPSALSE